MWFWQLDGSLSGHFEGLKVDVCCLELVGLLDWLNLSESDDIYIF